jgi:hypothetical protein
MIRLQPLMYAWQGEGQARAQRIARFTSTHGSPSLRFTVLRGRGSEVALNQLPDCFRQHRLPSCFAAGDKTAVAAAILVELL